MPGNGGAALGKGIEQPPQLLRLHANAGIHDPGHEQFLIAITTDHQGNGPLIGKFKGITTQVDNDLAQSGGVSAHLLRQRVFADDAEIQSFFPGSWREEGANLVKKFRQIDRYDVHIQFVRVDFRVVEDVVDQVQQMSAAAHHRLGTASFLRFTEIRIKQRFSVTDDGCQRCADLMAHIGQELAFRLRGIAGKLLLETLLLALPLDPQAIVTFGGVDAGAFQMGRLTLGVIHRMQ